MLEFSEEDQRTDQEIAGVGVGLGGGFYNTNELHVMKFKEAMKKDPKSWTKAVDEEHNRMVKNKAWRPMKLISIP